jgi:hypothetical protein
MGPSLDVRRTEAPDPDYRGTGGPLFVEPTLDPNAVEPAMVEGVLRQAHGCRGRLRAPRSSRDGAAAFAGALTPPESRRGGMDAPHQKLSVQPKLALEDLQCLRPLYASTVRPKPHYWQCVCHSRWEEVHSARCGGGALRRVARGRSSAAALSLEILRRFSTSIAVGRKGLCSNVITS